MSSKRGPGSQAMTGLPARADQWVGEHLERAVTSHHRRRLGRIGWERALNAGSGGLPGGWPGPREGNALEILVDGADALSAMAGEIRAARSHVHIAGWHVNPDFRIERRGPGTAVRSLLAEVAGRVPVRVLLWGGAPLPVFHPSRGDVRKVRERLCSGTAIRCALDRRERPMHCHHEKTIVVDDRVAFVGGIDLTDLAGDRYDTPRHPPRRGRGWHDVAARLEGPAVEDVAEHFRMRWGAVTGERLAAPVPRSPCGEVQVQVIRTVPEGMYEACRHGDFRILEAYAGALSSAARLIYLENQFLWSPEIVAILRDKLRNPPAASFRLLVVLPASPDSGADDTRGHLATLMEADGGAGRLLACALACAGPGGAQTYVHAKVGIVDDSWLTVGSANLNEHSLFNDTEVNLVTGDAGLARRTRERLWAEHLELPPGDVGGDPAAVIDRLWRPVAEEQARRRTRGERQTRRVSMLPGTSWRAGLLRGPFQGLLVDG